MKIDKAEIMRFIKASMDAYKRPREVEIVDMLPKNTLQKVLKRELLRTELAKRIKLTAETQSGAKRHNSTVPTGTQRSAP